jgi:branched-chain amino acid transport system substrate-binding protein
VRRTAPCSAPEAGLGLRRDGLVDSPAGRWLNRSPVAAEPCRPRDVKEEPTMLRRLIPLVLLLGLLSTVTIACQTAEKEVAPPEDGGQPAVGATVPTEGQVVAPAGVPAACADDPDMRKCAVIKPGETIKIGFAGPMTGDNAAFGQDISQAGQIAIEDLGDLDGFKVELVVQDDQGTPEGGSQVANKFVSDPRVVAIAGHTFSGATQAAIPIYFGARIPMLSGSATKADLTAGEQDVFNRIAFTDDVQGTNAATYLYDKLGVRNLAIVHDGSDYGEGLAEKVNAVFAELGGTVVGVQAITPSEADYSATLNAMGALKPDALYFGGYNAEAAVLKNQMTVAGMDTVVFFSDDGTFGKNFLDLTREGGKGEGTYATSAVPPLSPEREAFETKYKVKYGVDAGSLSTFTWHGYDIVAALISTIKVTGIMADDGSLYIPRDALVKAVRGLTGFAGLTGNITCSAIGECNTAGPTFFVVKDGQWVEAP